MKKMLFGVALLGVGVFAGGAKASPILGSQVTGTINFGGPGTNYFDPVNGFVPAGFLNTAGPTVTIADPAVEFGFEDGANRDTADFTGTQLIITDLVKSGAANWTMTFQDSAFVGATLTEISDNFPTGGLTATLVGDTITVTWAGTNTPGNFTGVFDLAPAAVPEPSTIAAFGLLGACGLVYVRRRTKAVVATVA